MAKKNKKTLKVFEDHLHRIAQLQLGSFTVGSGLNFCPASRPSEAVKGQPGPALLFTAH